MSKVCKQCGILHENRATKCAVCGTAFNDKHIYAKRRRIIILSVLAALLLVAAISYAAYSVTPEAAVRRIMNACRKAAQCDLVGINTEVLGKIPYILYRTLTVGEDRASVIRLIAIVNDKGGEARIGVCPGIQSPTLGRYIQQCENLLSGFGHKGLQKGGGNADALQKIIKKKIIIWVVTFHQIINLKILLKM